MSDDVEQQLTKVAKKLQVGRMFAADHQCFKSVVAVDNRLDVVEPPKRGPKRLIARR